ncbi:MAG: hypothetical protein JSS26_20300 [Nitrospira sp.]|nr:hypothetical protein [Nitrospira sp.]
MLQIMCERNTSKVCDGSCDAPGCYAKYTPKITYACGMCPKAELLDALQTVMRMKVGEHQLQDRLQFSDAGRAILSKVNAAVAKATGVEPNA